MESEQSQSTPPPSPPAQARPLFTPSNLYVWGALLLLVACVVGYLKYWPDPTPPPLPAPVTQAEREFVRSAHQLGTRLLAISRRADDLGLPPSERQVKLKPVYNQVEEFIFNNLAGYSNRITSIVVMFQDPGVQCMIYVKPGEDQELAEIKKIADTCVGRIIENLPFVKYLMIKNEAPPPEEP